MAYIPIETGLWSARRSRCSAGSGTQAGKRCAPGHAAAGLCPVPVGGLRKPEVELTRTPRVSRRLNKTVRAVCRLWWRGPEREFPGQ